MPRRTPAPDACCPSDAPPTVLPGATPRARAVPVLRALADPTRLEILALVASRPEPICVCDIVARFDLGQPTISHHLKVLREAGLVTASRRGTWSYYAIDPRGARAARAAVDAALPDPRRTRRLPVVRG